MSESLSSHFPDGPLEPDQKQTVPDRAAVSLIGQERRHRQGRVGDRRHKTLEKDRHLSLKVTNQAVFGHVTQPSEYVTGFRSRVATRLSSAVSVVHVVQREHAMEHYRVQIAANGRMVLPASLRQQLHVEGGGLLIIREDEGRLVLESVDDAVRRAQALVRRYAPEAQSVTDELLAERRADAARE